MRMADAHVHGTHTHVHTRAPAKWIVGVGVLVRMWVKGGKYIVCMCVNP